MFNYGGQIRGTVFLDHFSRIRNRIITKYQYDILKRFSRMPFQSQRSALFSRTARRLVGGYIYSIKLEVNDFCNLKCKMCYVDSKKTELSKNVIFDLFNQISSFGIRIEILGGEPLMRSDIVEIIRYAKQQVSIPFVSIYTNGTTVTPVISDKLKTAGLDAALVTLISHKREVHDHFTGIEGSWDKTVEGIRHLVAAKINTYAFTTVHRENYKDYKKIYQFVKQELGVHALFYQYIPQQRNDPLMIDPVAWHEIKHWLLMEANAQHMKFVRDFYMLTGNACSGGNFVLTVKADGSVQPCPFIYDLPLGNICENSIWDIYRNRFRESGLKEFKSNPYECSECVYRSICGGGCKAGNNLMYGSYNCRDHRCLGPFSKALKGDRIMDDIPTFF